MAKGMQRSNREVRKPKANKPKMPAASVSPFPPGGAMKKGQSLPSKKPR